MTNEIDIFEDLSFSPFQLRAMGLASEYRTICLLCGRRTGKTAVGHALFATWILKELADTAEKIERGEESAWPGLDMPRSKARFVAPHSTWWCVAPRERHLDEIRSWFIKLFSGEREFLLNPIFPGGLYDKGKQLWLCLGGAVARIDFICASSEAGMVSKSLAGAWCDEAGFIPNDRFQALRPAMMDRAGKLLCSGTPSMGDDHWFTILSFRGLRPGEERYDESMATADPEVRTLIGNTIEDAYLAEARKQAKKEAEFWGSTWARQWIFADPRQRSVSVYSEWNSAIHHAVYHIGLHRMLGNTRIDKDPDDVIGMIDWTGGSRPGAAVIAHVWYKNPLNRDDNRPLVVIVDEVQSTKTYTNDGWWADLDELESAWAPSKWIADPHAPALIKECREAGFHVVPGPQADKMGRVRLVAGLLHHADNIAPALYVSRRCKHLPIEFSRYRFRVDREGRVTDKTIDIYDHSLDCLAMLAPEVCNRGLMAIGSSII